MPLQIIRQDITKIECDAIVNPSNCDLKPGGGVDLAVHTEAGQELQESCKALGGCEIGKAVITQGFKLPCKYVIHTAGPAWNNEKPKEQEKLLKSCYKECLKLAKENNCKSVAVPLISAGLYGFPHEIVLRVATNVIQEFLFENEMLVYLVVYDKKAFATTEKIFSDIQAFIDDVYVDEHTEFRERSLASYSMPRECLDVCEISKPIESDAKKTRRKRASGSKRVVGSCRDLSIEATEGKASLEEMLSSIDDTFAVTLLKLIDIKGMSDVECYKKANVSKQTWYKIMNDSSYKPSKNTVIAFAISLGLTLSETKHLLSTVGFALSRSSKFDIIIEYYISNEEYDIFKINETLFKFDQVGLGV